MRKAFKFGDPTQRDRSIGFKNGFDPAAYASAKLGSLRQRSRPKPGDQGPKPCPPRKPVWNVISARDGHKSKVQPITVSGGIVCNHKEFDAQYHDYKNIYISFIVVFAFFLFCHASMPLDSQRVLLARPRRPNRRGRHAKKRRYVSISNVCKPGRSHAWNVI